MHYVVIITYQVESCYSSNDLDHWDGVEFKTLKDAKEHYEYMKLYDVDTVELHKVYDNKKFHKQIELMKYSAIKN